MDWIRDHGELLNWLMLVTALVSVVAIVLIPVVVTRIPRDYFLYREAPPLPWSRSHPALRIVLTGFKNVVGACLVLAGIGLLVLPGQGILTLLIGLALLDFPGKRAMELRLVRIRSLRRLLNWMRTRAGKEPLDLGETPGMHLHSRRGASDPPGRGDDG